MLKSIINKLKLVFLFLLSLALLHHFFLEEVKQFSIKDDKLYIMLDWQREIDRYAPLSASHLQGTHNSYNSDAYHNLFRYHDRQQVLTLRNQLDNGARFIELDTHWTFSAQTFKQDFLLCHGSSKFNFLPFHWGCSPYDLPLKDGLLEISEWLEEEKNKDEFLILYIEDHTEANHEALYQLLEETGLIERIYPSGACIAIPDELTKAHVLDAGKQIILWKDELRMGMESISCADNKNIAELAFNELGNLKRRAEDRTLMGSLDKRWRHGAWPRIHPYDVHDHLLEGVNILNLDDFESDDGRLYQLLWSWNLDTNLEMSDGCAVMLEDGSWLLQDCNKSYSVACANADYTQWKISDVSIIFEDAHEACASLSIEERFHFSAPINFSENHMLFTAMETKKLKKIWLNVRRQNYALEVGDKRSYSSETKRQSN